MTTIAETRGRFDHSAPQECSTDANVTRSLLGYLALAGPFYVVVSLGPGVDPKRVQPDPR